MPTSCRSSPQLCVPREVPIVTDRFTTGRVKCYVNPVTLESVCGAFELSLMATTRGASDKCLPRSSGEPGRPPVLPLSRDDGPQGGAPQLAHGQRFRERRGADGLYE